MTSFFPFKRYTEVVLTPPLPITCNSEAYNLGVRFLATHAMHVMNGQDDITCCGKGKQLKQLGRTQELRAKYS
jgi:hypothetical protein